jgi:hypothetical protein
MRIRDPGWKKFGSGIRDGKKLGSGINIPDPDPNPITGCGSGSGQINSFKNMPVAIHNNNITH